LLLSLVSFAQEGTSSPYSYYGIGDVRFKTVENRSMAGIAVEQDSIHINLQNPASFANLKFTTFALGVLIILLQ
jgi:long-subunit fatty acid transport protein